jgi:hypothetical protein
VITPGPLTVTLFWPLPLIPEPVPPVMLCPLRLIVESAIPPLTLMVIADPLALKSPVTLYVPELVIVQGTLIEVEHAASALSGEHDQRQEYRCR